MVVDIFRGGKRESECLEGELNLETWKQRIEKLASPTFNIRLAFIGLSVIHLAERRFWGIQC